MNERDIALREGEQNAAEAAYFGARPYNDTEDRMRVFGAGFQRGWDAAVAAERERCAKVREALAASQSWLYGHINVEGQAERRRLNEEVLTT